MPVEIRELVIKATVMPEGGAANINSPVNNTISSGEEMINACIEKIIEITKERNER